METKPVDTPDASSGAKVPAEPPTESPAGRFVAAGQAFSRWARRFRLVRWWLDENASSGRELSSYSLIGTTLVVSFLVAEVWKHSSNRAEGAASALQIVVVLVGAPVLVAKLLPDGMPNVPFDRVWLSNTVRWPLRHRRATRSFSTTMLVAGIVTAYFGAVAVAASLLMIATASFVIAWLGLFLPRRYTAPIDRKTAKLTTLASIGRHPKAEALTALAVALLLFTAYMIQFFSLYSIWPFH